MNPKKTSVATDSRSRFTLSIHRFVVSLTALGMPHMYSILCTNHTLKGASLQYQDKDPGRPAFRYAMHVRGVLGNKCAGQHNLKTVQIREIV